MSLQPNLEQQEFLADTFQRQVSRMSARELTGEVTACVGFVVAVAALWWLHPPHSFAIAPGLVCLLVLAIATLIRIDTPFGFTVPTQLAFVPLLFAMPLAVVPVAVAIAFAIARLPGVLRGEMQPVRLFQCAANSWFAIGPVAVLALANVEPRMAGAGLLLAALAAQFAVDFVVSVLRFAVARRATLSAQLGETWVYSVDAALSGVAFVVAKDVYSSPAAMLALLPLLGVLAVFARERRERLEGLLELNNAYRGTALVLGDVVEADDGYTGEHCRSVVELALSVGAHMGLSAERRRDLEFGALLHDVGKIAIPKEIINKPGKLDPDEWKIIRTHTIEGQKMLDRVGGFMHEVGLIVRSHHERWDGGGYPDGLAGEGIPLEARIISCCDTWNAMRTDRSYRKALSHEVAMTELLASAGGQLDRRVVDALAEIVGPQAVLEAARAKAIDAAGARPGNSSPLAGSFAP